MKRGISLALAVLLMFLLAGASLGEASKDESRTPMPYSRVYEPETSWSMSATVAWDSVENGRQPRRARKTIAN